MTTERRPDISEYQETLEELGGEQEILKQTESRTKKRLLEIGTEVKRIMALCYGSESRVLARVLRNKSWDRRVPKGQESVLDVAQLEVRLGKAKFRELCCDRQTVYTWNEAKVEQARKGGDITDADLAACMTDPVPGTPSIQLITTPDETDDLSDL